MEHKQVINFGAGPAKLPKSVSAVLGIFYFFLLLPVQSSERTKVAFRGDARCRLDILQIFFVVVVGGFFFNCPIAFFRN